MIKHLFTIFMICLCAGCGKDTPNNLPTFSFDENGLLKVDNIGQAEFEQSARGEGWVRTSAHQIMPDGTCKEEDYYAGKSGSNDGSYLFFGQKNIRYYYGYLYLSLYRDIPYFHGGTPSNTNEIKILSANENTLETISFSTTQALLYCTYRKMTDEEKEKVSHFYLPENHFRDYAQLAYTEQNEPYVPNHTVTAEEYRKQVIGHKWECIANYYIPLGANDYMPVYEPDMSVPDDKYIYDFLLLPTKDYYFGEETLQTYSKKPDNPENVSYTEETYQTGTPPERIRTANENLMLVSVEGDELRIIRNLTKGHFGYSIYRKVVSDKP